MTFQKVSDTSIISALRRRGFRATSQRIAICRFALGSREHPTAQRIFTEVRKVHPTVSLATVYKTLQVLKELHLVQELAFPTRRAVSIHLRSLTQTSSVSDAEKS